MTRLRVPAAALALAALGAMVVAARLHTRDEPLDRDIATYAVVARELRAGRALYSDLWDHKPPAVYVAYAAAQVVAGEGTASVFLLGVVLAVATLLVLHAAGAHGQGRAAGLTAAAAWAVVSADLALEANQPNTEALINLALAGAFLLLLHAGGRRARRASLGAAACLAVATLVKPIAIATAAALAVAHVLHPPAGVRRRTAAVQAFLLLVLPVLAWATMGGYLAATGRWDDGWKALVVFNRHYAGPLPANLVQGLTPARLLGPALHAVIPLFAVAAAWLVLAALRRPQRGDTLLAAWLLSVPILVAAPGRFFPHYYQLWLPPLCLAAAWGMVRFGALPGVPALARTVAAAGLVALLAARQLPSYTLSAEEWSRAKYGDVFVRARDIARLVDGMLLPGETFYQWGDEPEMYFYARRPPPLGVLWRQHLVHGPLRLELRARAHTQLGVSDPELVVADRDHGHPPGALGRWLSERYEPHPLQRKRQGFTFWVRRGGKLSTRAWAVIAARSRAPR